VVGAEGTTLGPSTTPSMPSSLRVCCYNIQCAAQLMGKQPIGQ